MAAHKKESMQKHCENCGAIMIQPRWENGKLDSTFKDRKFCGSKCYGTANMVESPTLSTIRKRDQRTTTATVCKQCGSTENIQRHHEGGKLKAILCQTCHTAVHVNAGTWGHGGNQNRPESQESQGA